MDHFAVFVDAGYLFAQGSTAIAGNKIKRHNIVLNEEVAISSLKRAACDLAPGCRLLRIYWYDAPPRAWQPSPSQSVLAGMNDVKLRLGFMNSAGEQKGVDSLIVTDLVELARLKSICDAVLLSGDEDVRIGVQIAQSYGVRVHLLGIVPARGSQSHQLIHEADTHSEFQRIDIEEFLSVRPDVITAQAAHEPPAKPEEAAPSSPDEVALYEVVDNAVEVLQLSEISALKEYWNGGRGVPAEHDRRMIAKCRTRLGRDLTPDERRMVRARFQTSVTSR